MDLDEVWKPVIGFKGYEASSLGRIRSIDRSYTNSLGRVVNRKGIILKLSISKQGYHTVGFGKKMTPKKVSRIVFQAFNGKISPTIVVDHINQNKLDDRISNLRAATRQQNSINVNKYGKWSSRYKGVTRKVRSKMPDKWEAHCKNFEKTVYLGLYNTEEAAAHAYDQYVLNKHGEFAVLNNAPIEGVDLNPIRVRGKVKCLNTGEIFKNATEASIKLGLTLSKVCDNINGVVESTKGYKFERVEE